MRSPARGLAAAVLAVSVLGVSLAACTGDQPVGGDETPGLPEQRAAEAVAAFAEAWTAVDAATLARLTTAPRAARAGFTGLATELDVARASVEPDGVLACAGVRCRQALHVRLDLRGIGTWTYDTEATARLDLRDGWQVEWAPALLHPALTDGTALARARTLPGRASIIDRSGRPLTEERRVYRVGVVPGEARPASYGRIAGLLGVDGAGLRERAAAAEPGWFVDVITLRAADYEPVRDQLLDVPGVSVDPGRLSLPASSSWGRAILGTVAPATDESLDGASDVALETDYVGASGLQGAFEPSLAGTAGGQVLLVDSASGQRRETLWSQPTVPGEQLETTLSYAVQDAGERAVAGQTQPTVLVAVDARSGQILADVNGPELTSYDSGLVGSYPPGSAFKVVSTAALVAAGQDVEEPAACPSTTVVDGKRFKNAEFNALPPGSTFADAIAASCNTTVVDRAGELDDAALTEAAEQFGVGAGWELPVPAYAGTVPVADGLVDRAASMIGQGRVLMSPLGMALVAGTVASGQARTPALLPGEGGDPVGTLDQPVAADLRRIMRLVVTEGTATSLRGLPGGVAAKTGTAEFGDTVPLDTHGWMIGYRGDLAFACIVVGGEGGNAAAGPVVRRFLELAPSVW